MNLLATNIGFVDFTGLPFEQPAQATIPPLPIIPIYIGLVDFAGYPFEILSPIKRHGHSWGAGKHVQHMAIAMMQAQRERAEMKARAAYQQRAKERLIAEHIQREQAELFHQQKVLAAASWTALLAEV